MSFWGENSPPLPIYSLLFPLGSSLPLPTPVPVICLVSILYLARPRKLMQLFCLVIYYLIRSNYTFLVFYC